MMLDAVDEIEAPRCVDEPGQSRRSGSNPMATEFAANTRSYNCGPVAGHRRRVGRELGWHSGLTAGVGTAPNAPLRQPVQLEVSRRLGARGRIAEAAPIAKAETKELNVRRAAELPDWIASATRTRIPTEGHAPTRRMDRRLER